MTVESGFEAVERRGIQRGRYRKHSIQAKRTIVQQCLAPGASVAAVALAHGVNANLLRKWIPKYRAGDYGAVHPGVTLLPVTVSEATSAAASHETAPPCKGHMDVDVTAGRVQVYGRVDVEALRAVLVSLRR